MGFEEFLEGREVKAVELLKKNNIIITTAESCTGGLIAASIVNVSGASNIFKQGFITYSDETKESLIGVSKDIIDKYKAVSDKTAAAMAECAARKAASQMAVSVTGVAGPSMEDGKPVGLVYVGLYYNGNTYVSKNNFKGDRKAVRYQAVKKAFDMIIDTLSA